MKIYVVLNIKVGKYDVILYYKDIYVLVFFCVNFCFVYGFIFVNSIIKMILIVFFFVKFV